MRTLLLLEGPNLNMLGQREPRIYGQQTAGEIQQELVAAFEGRCRWDFFQSNHEGALIDRVQALTASEPADGVVLNPGGLTHTSVALRDAVAAVDRPFIEVHLSNVHRREPFRRLSYFSDLAVGVIAGLGPMGYGLAAEALLEHLSA